MNLSDKLGADGISAVSSAVLNRYTQNMNTSTPLDQIRQLPVAEQLAIVEQIWDGLHESRELIQDWQIDEARRRSAEIESDPSMAISEEEVWKRVDKIRE